MLAKKAVSCVTSSVLPTPALPSHVDLEQRCQLANASTGLLTSGVFLQTPLAGFFKCGSQLSLVKKKGLGEKLFLTAEKSLKIAML